MDRYSRCVGCGDGYSCCVGCGAGWIAAVIVHSTWCAAPQCAQGHDEGRPLTGPMHSAAAAARPAAERPHALGQCAGGAPAGRLPDSGQPRRALLAAAAALRRGAVVPHRALRGACWACERAGVAASLKRLLFLCFCAPPCPVLVGFKFQVKRTVVEEEAHLSRDCLSSWSAGGVRSRGCGQLGQDYEDCAVRHCLCGGHGRQGQPPAVCALPAPPAEYVAVVVDATLPVVVVTHHFS